MASHISTHFLSVARRMAPILLYGVYAYFCWRLLLIAAQYMPLRNDVAFLRIKQDVAVLAHYRLAFFVHVYSTMLVLPAGFLQFSRSLRTRFPVLHRSFGWLYSLVVLVFASTSGFWMGLFANGGFLSQLSFCLLALAWFYFTFQAVQYARRKQFVRHRNFMIRSFALALSAITLRIWKPLLVYFFHPHPMDVYRLVAWLGWTLNWLLAELIILILTNHEKNLSPLANGPHAERLSGK